MRPEVAVWTITPESAQLMLGQNKNNRNIRQTVVTRYARDMAAGEWALNGETIKLTEDGRVLDGQHRLQAVVESGVTVKMFVVSNLSDDAQETIDRGLPRNIADALRLRGEQNVNVLAGAISQAIVVQSPAPSTSALFWPSSREALHFLDEHPSIRESVVVGARVRDTIFYPASTAAAMHFLFSTIDPEDADAFWASVMDGVGLASDSPILRLRELMLRELTAQRRMNRARLNALTIKTWNAWRRGEPMLQLRWKVGGSKPEVFPKPE